MRRWSGKRWAATAGLGALLTVVAGGIALRARLVEEWHIWRLESGAMPVRRAAATRLAELRSARAVPAIVDLLRDLEDNDPESTARKERSRETTRIGRLLPQIGPPAVPALAGAILADRRPRVLWRRCIFRALRQIHEETGDPMVELLERLSDDEDLCLRLAAISTLGRAGPAAEPALPTLARAAEDENRTVQRAAQRAIETIRRESR